MNKGIIKAFTIFLALTVMSSMAFAWDETEHVKLAPNGKGDLIIFPFYFTANGGWETKLTVVNTSTEYSVVAKVIVRSHYYSEELLDFLIYLTPADVWTGTMRNEGQGALIHSTDDSMLVAADTFASAANPVNKLLFPPTCTDVSPFDSADFGYIEVVQSWYADLSNDGYVTNFLENGERSERPVSKTYLKRVYDAWLTANGPDNGVEFGAPGQPRDTNILDHTINVLAASMEFQNPIIGGISSAMRATVFADYDTQSALDATEVTGIQTINARNTIGELEAALAKDDLAMEYVNRPESGDISVHIVNFPTKISSFSTNTSTFCRYIDGFGPFWDDPTVPSPDSFADSAYRCLTYTSPIYDLEENTQEPPPGDVFSGGEEKVEEFSFCEEVNILVTSGFPALFNEGWVNYNFVYTGRDNNPTAFTPEAPGVGPFAYYGTPAIATIIKFVNGGAAMMESAHTDGEVFNTFTPGMAMPAPDPWYGTGSWLPDYQYYNELNAMGLNSFSAVAPPEPPAPTEPPPTEPPA